MKCLTFSLAFLAAISFGNAAYIREIHAETANCDDCGMVLGEISVKVNLTWKKLS